jgi:hypothetical protein
MPLDRITLLLLRWANHDLDVRFDDHDDHHHHDHCRSVQVDVG